MPTGRERLNHSLLNVDLAVHREREDTWVVLKDESGAVS